MEFWSLTGKLPSSYLLPTKFCGPFYTKSIYLSAFCSLLKRCENLIIILFQRNLIKFDNIQICCNNKCRSLILFFFFFCNFSKVRIFYYFTQYLKGVRKLVRVCSNVTLRVGSRTHRNKALVIEKKNIVLIIEY